jgi:hypothetical protein
MKENENILIFSVAFKNIRSAVAEHLIQRNRLAWGGKWHTYDVKSVLCFQGAFKPGGHAMIACSEATALVMVYSRSKRFRLSFLHRAELKPALLMFDVSTPAASKGEASDIKTFIHSVHTPIPHTVEAGDEFQLSKYSFHFEAAGYHEISVKVEPRLLYFPHSAIVEVEV